MADDIVEVLRKGGHKINEHHCEVCDEFCCASELCDCCYDALNSATQAADEIDRLRAENQRMRQVFKEAIRILTSGGDDAR